MNLILISTDTISANMNQFQMKNDKKLTRSLNYPAVKTDYHVPSVVSSRPDELTTWSFSDLFCPTDNSSRIRLLSVGLLRCYLIAAELLPTIVIFSRLVRIATLGIATEPDLSFVYLHLLDPGLQMHLHAVVRTLKFAQTEQTARLTV